MKPLRQNTFKICSEWKVTNKWLVPGFCNIFLHKSIVSWIISVCHIQINLIMCNISEILEHATSFAYLWYFGVIISHFSWIKVRSHTHDRIELAKVEWKWFRVIESWKWSVTFHLAFLPNNNLLTDSIEYQISAFLFQVRRILYLFGMISFSKLNFHFTISNTAHCNSMFFSNKFYSTHIQ